MPIKSMHPAAAIIRRLCAEKRISFAELSRRTGISQPAMGRWFRGEVIPKLESRRLVARALGVPLSELITDDESTTEHATDEANEAAIERYLQSEYGSDMTEEEQRQLRAAPSWMPGTGPFTREAIVSAASLIRLMYSKREDAPKPVLNPKGSSPSSRKRRR